ncbi:MAG TPA: alkaline phosphatase family protein [Anaerolineae bacterium]|nr:alkaline phosphatase family protein [Anaerolineae bacterium]
MPKLMVIGIDSLEPTLLRRFEPDLPNFTRLRRQSPEIQLQCIFPPDSIPAWVSIHTGLNPAQHGLIHVFDVFETQWQDILSIDPSAFQGRTFWDYASNAGKRVLVLFPFVAFPPWEVNGLMVGRAMADRRRAGGSTWQTERELIPCPREAQQQYGLPPLLKEVSGKHPGKDNLAARTVEAHEEIREKARLGLELSARLEWDLFFIFFGSLDVVQHSLWRYMDESDPTYPGPNPLQNLIRETYKVFDDVIGQLMDQHPDATVVVLSDHGHGMRPTKTVNINELLRQMGLLAPKGHRLNPLPRAMEGLKRMVLDFVHERELDYWLLALGKASLVSSASKGLYMSTASIDMDRTVAYLSSFAGAKSYSHGGIEIRRDHLGDGEYEDLRDRLIEELTQKRSPDEDSPLMSWICKREDLYSGPHISQFPNIVFELEDGYGVYWGIHTPLVGTAYEHNLASGGHKKDAVFLLSGTDRHPRSRQTTLMDVAPTILDLLGVKDDLGFDGHSIFA